VLGIVVSRADSASDHVGEHLLSIADWTERNDANRPDAEGGGTVHHRPGAELRTFDALHLEIADAADAFAADLDLLVFASRHAGETGALLTAHFTGNFGPADHGGEPSAFARAAPNAQKRVVAALADHAPEDYEVGIECTHHGPTDLSVPSMFVELGSGEAQWSDPAGAEAVARAVLDLEGVAPDADGTAEGEPNRQVVGFGGGHYAPRFERVVRETPWAVGHIGADWGLDAMGDPRENREVVEAAFEASAAEYALLEADRPDLRAVIEDLGYRAVSETWVREVGDAPLSVVRSLEDALSTVEDGLRLGDRVDDVSVVDSDPAFSVVPLPDDLLEAAQGIDAAAVRETVERAAVAFETVQGGSRARGRAALTAAADGEALIEDLASVLSGAYDSVEREGAEVVARREAFDPEKARTLGVSEGPAFGKLSAGEAVEVGGREIAPAAVRSEQVDRFSVAGAMPAEAEE
jgi:D-aminoacyl-tRNA deacylase